MTPADYHAEQLRLGWQALAMRVFNLRPAEADALGLLMRHPGRMVTVAALAAYDGAGTASKCLTGSHRGVCRRVQRLRLKLRDAGCDHVRPLGGLTGDPIAGFSIAPAHAARIEAALRFACGVESERAA